MLNNADDGKYGKNVEVFREISNKVESVEQGWKVANNVKKYQTMSKSIEQCQKVSNNVKKYWIMLGNLEKCWI